MNNELTVIISLHKTDRPNWFAEAARSVLDQSSRPSHMLITVDGDLLEAHEMEIRRLKQDYALVSIEEVRHAAVNSRGILLGLAVSNSKTELIAIMDADDVSDPSRFQKQIRVFNENQNVDVVGSWIKEVSPTDISHACFRKVPELHSDICKFARFRNPINNMTVMFKKNAVLRAGNYSEMLDFADYWLWVRMIQHGFEFYNIQEVLVTARAAEDMVGRRIGYRYIRNEFHFYKKCYEIKFLGAVSAALIFLMRAPLRLMPKRLLAVTFKSILRG